MVLIKSDRGIGYFPSYIKSRIEKNKNFIACVTGQTGSGKSYSVLRLAEQLDPNFDVNNICFTAQEFVDLIDGKTKPLKRGANIIWDEMQTSMSNLDFQSLQSKLINYLLATFRYQNFILWVTTPHFSFINAQSRKLFHSRIETISINKNTKTCFLKPFLLQCNQETGKIYRKFLRVKTENGIIPISQMGVKLASKELIKAYEQKKDEWNKELRDDVRADLDKMKEGDSKRPPTEQQKRIIELLVERNVVPEVANVLKVTDDYIRKQMNLIRKKGITITPVKEKAKILRYNVEGYETRDI